MASIDYQEVFENFLGNINDPDLFNLNASDAYSLMAEYLHKTVANPYVRHLFITAELDDETQVFSYEVKNSVDDNTDKEFIITALGKWMAYEWLQKEAKSKLLTSQFFGGKEAKFYAQSSQLSNVQALRDSAYKEARDYIRDNGYINNPYLSEQS